MSLLPYCFSDVVLLVFSLCLSDVLGGGAEELKGLRNKKLKWPILLFRACGYKSEKRRIDAPIDAPIDASVLPDPPPLEPILRY